MEFIDKHYQPVSKPEDVSVQWRISVYTIVESEGNVLLVLPKHVEHYILPGGGAELTESIFDTAIRECWEETGYRIRIEEQRPLFVGETYFADLVQGTYNHSVNIVLKGVLVEEKQYTEIINSVEKDEVQEVCWIPWGELNISTCYPFIQEVMLQAQQEFLQKSL